MTLNDVLLLADGLRPNPLEEELKGRWICDLEMRTARETGRTVEPRSWPESRNLPLTIDGEYAYLCVLHLCAMIDHALGEQESYNQAVVLYNQWIDQYKKQQLRAELPPRQTFVNVWRDRS